MTAPDWLSTTAALVGPDDLLVLRVDPDTNSAQVDLLRAMAEPLLSGRYVILPVPEMLIVQGAGLDDLVPLDGGDPIRVMREPADRLHPPIAQSTIYGRVCSWTVVMASSWDVEQRTPCTFPVDHALVYLSAASVVVDRDLVCEAHSMAAYDLAAKTVPSGLIHSVVIRRIDRDGEMMP